jgi:hypothetical protein
MKYGVPFVQLCGKLNPPSQKKEKKGCLNPSLDN